jgi:hypothetical protein
LASTCFITPETGSSIMRTACIHWGMPGQLPC